ncbi:MAG: phosphatidylserine decarboxylase family protein [Pirellulales bacterium]|nr:phosphatidylserine decarboxylase family protein [Pirellulales bacterium]
MRAAPETQSQQAPNHVPLPANIPSVQPGGGFCYGVELAWGRWRRWYLTRFRRPYVDRMAKLRRGEPAGAPHEILDPRDLKYCSNQCTAHWLPEDDPFRWRERLPFARWGLAELQIMGWPLALSALAIGLLRPPWSYAAILPLALLGLVVYFFRDPRRFVPADPAAVISPADGVVAEVTELDHYDFLDGPAVRIGIFLSIFNVHINRAPRTARVVAMHYKPGEFLNALNPESAIRNEFMWIGFEDGDRPDLRYAVRQISGLLARRIVCALRPGQSVRRGEKFGMIKLGSRTELILPRDAVQIATAVGDVVRAGSTVLARLK